MMISAFATDNADEIVELKSDQGFPVGEFSIKYRPFLHEFLDDMMEKFELVVYSTFGPKHVQAIVDCIERRKKYFTYRFHEDFCLFANISSSVKCIDFLYGNRSKADIIVVDTRAKTLPLTVDNFVPISSYMGDDSKDRELVKLATILDKLSKEKDVTSAIKAYQTVTSSQT